VRFREPTPFLPKIIPLTNGVRIGINTVIFCKNNASQVHEISKKLFRIKKIYEVNKSVFTR
jgi:hypothetical protein